MTRAGVLLLSTILEFTTCGHGREQLQSTPPKPDTATDAFTRDMIVASFFVYRAWHVLLTPWQCEAKADFTGVRLKMRDTDDKDGGSQIMNEKETMRLL